MSSLIIDCPVDPKSVSINISYRDRRVIPTVVRQGQKKIREAAKAEQEKTGWLVPAGPLGAIYSFTFNDERGDTDNSIKRTQDAIAEALGFDDVKIVELHARRYIGTPGIRVELYETTLPEGAAPTRSYQRHPQWDFDDE